MHIPPMAATSEPVIQQVGCLTLSLQHFAYAFGLGGGGGPKCPRSSGEQSVIANSPGCCVGNRIGSGSEQKRGKSERVVIDHQALKVFD